MKYTQLSVEEREKIQELLWRKASVREIARQLGRDASSISREIKRNQTEQRRLYRPRLAHEKALERRTHRGPRKLDSNERLKVFVTTQLKLGWSPEQIAAKAREAVGTGISYEAIYQYVYAQIHRGG